MRRAESKGLRPCHRYESAGGAVKGTFSSSTSLAARSPRRSMMACDDQMPEVDAASTVSVTKIHSWLREKRYDQSRCGGKLKRRRSHIWKSSVCSTKVRSMNLHAAQTSCSKSESSALVWSKSESNKRNCIKCRARSAHGGSGSPPPAVPQTHVPVRSEGQARGQRDVGYRSGRRALEDTSRPVRGES